MKEVRKKSADAAVNQMIAKAHREGVALVWDRAEAMQPQCGFGRMAICCTDCLEGPCRVNPFAETALPAICGRDSKSLVAAHLLKKTADGATALMQLAAELGCQLEVGTWQAIAQSADSMVAPQARFQELGQAVAAVLTGIAAQAKPAKRTTPAGMGVLESAKPNIVCHGHVPQRVVEALVKATAGAANIVSICGSERSLPVATNYGSQETLLLTGLVDLLVLGSQCVTPAMTALAEKLSVPVISASVLNENTAVEQAGDCAEASFKRRAGKPVSVLPASKDNFTGHDPVAGKGIVYLGGCGNIKHTQDAQMVRTASFLVESGYTVFTGGCAGTALAKAGMCDAKSVINLGSCHDAGDFLAVAAKAKSGSVPVFAVMIELTHNKTLATAVAYAGQGIPTFVDLGEISVVSEMFGGNLRPLADWKELPRMLAEKAAAR
jgi:hydroxylamine reductase (hybrid-cluster protein)